MFFTSLEQTLAKLTNQPSWERYQQYRQLLECWQRIVSKEIDKQTRPIYINRQVLGVATSNSVWAQELTLQRYSLLKKLNSQLSFSLKDIRFSPSQWQTDDDRNELAPDSSHKHSLHPSSINLKSTELSTDNSSLIKDPQAVVQQWIDTLQARSSKLSICPQCQSSTPEGELKRWSLCCHCAAKNWSSK